MSHITIAVINIKSNGDAISEAAKPKIPEPSKPGRVRLTQNCPLNKKLQPITTQVNPWLMRIRFTQISLTQLFKRNTIPKVKVKRGLISGS